MVTAAGMGRTKVPLTVVVFLSLLIAPQLSALTPDSDVIILTLWTEVSKPVPSLSEDPSPDDLEGLSKKILTDAVWIISGMIYGFDIKYVPLNKERGIEEIFTVDPVHSIPFGDPSLRVVSSRFENGRFVVEVRYDLAEFQLRRLALWNSNIYPEAEGLGTASLFKGEAARIGAVEDGIKMALRNYLRARIRNKPREITAKVLLDQSPYITIDAGGYKARTRIKLKVEKVIPYTLY